MWWFRDVNPMSMRALLRSYEFIVQGAGSILVQVRP
jgi:hypothetical protein